MGGRWRCTRCGRSTAATPARPLAGPGGGPLRIVVAIAAPTARWGWGAGLRTGAADGATARCGGPRRGTRVVRVVPFATTAAIRAALTAGTAHVLHLSGHGGPGVLILENDDGHARRVTAAQFLSRRPCRPGGCRR